MSNGVNVVLVYLLLTINRCLSARVMVMSHICSERYFTQLGSLEKLQLNTTEQLNPLQPGVAFFYPLKTSENLKVF